MLSDQYVIGLKNNFLNFETGMECYYKTMQNLTEYKEGIEYLESTNTWENQIEIGKGEAYGCEWSVNIIHGKTTARAGYTLSWANRTFNNINHGNAFFDKYDRRHDLSFAVLHTFSDKTDVGLTWVFNSGNRQTLPVQKYAAADGSTEMLYYYSERNGYKLPAYHRLDLCANFYKKKKYGTRVWTISVYNAYCRQNPYYVYVETKSGVSVLKQKILFPVLPSISYTFKF